jgi:serine phosphatase RsbU (regulator of sigma subunit)
VACAVHPVEPVQLTRAQASGSPATRVSRELGEFRLVAECHAASAGRGGDFYYASQGTQGRLAVVIGDACGRGAEAAQLLAALMPSVRALVRPGLGPACLLQKLNREVAATLPEDRFVTAAAFELDLQAGVLLAANAGHVPAFVRRAAGGVLLIGRASVGPALGLMPDVTYTEERVELRRGDLLVFMTDGIVEAVENDLLEMRHLRQLVDLAPNGRVHSSVGRVLREVECTPDDRTLVCLQVLSSANGKKGRS